MIVLELDARARVQLAALLRRLPALCRANGVTPSTALLTLTAALSRSTPLESVGHDSGAFDPHAADVDRLLHPYDEVGQMLGGLSTDTIEKLVREGRLAAVNVGRRRFVPHAAVLAYVESLEAA